ncbi:MAG: hypothetical protein ACFCD0_04045 [Gemmataceae bacterium]
MSTSTLLVLPDIELVPVLEFDPSVLSPSSRQTPRASCEEAPEEWAQFWKDSLADAGIFHLKPVKPTSWFVPARDLTDLGNVHKFLNAIFADWGGMDAVQEPDYAPLFTGGLALVANQGDVVFEPDYASDLEDLYDWRAAVDYRDEYWTSLWAGHPWLSLRFDHPWLILNDPVEGVEPPDRWAVAPEDLEFAVVAAERELEIFAQRLQPVLRLMGLRKKSRALAYHLAGLGTRD